jgi:hypothetical protein
LYIVAKGAKILTSKDCKRCVVYRGRHNRMIFEAIQNQIAVVEKCNVWLSSIKSRYSSLSQVFGSKQTLSHLSLISLSVHLFFDVVICTLGSAENHAFKCCFALNITYGCVRRLLSDIHLINETHSWFLGWVI